MEVNATKCCCIVNCFAPIKVWQITMHYYFIKTQWLFFYFTVIYTQPRLYNCLHVLIIIDDPLLVMPPGTELVGLFP